MFCPFNAPARPVGARPCSACSIVEAVELGALVEAVEAVEVVELGAFVGFAMGSMSRLRSGPTSAPCAGLMSACMVAGSVRSRTSCAARSLTAGGAVLSPRSCSTTSRACSPRCASRCPCAAIRRAVTCARRAAFVGSVSCRHTVDLCTPSRAAISDAVKPSRAKSTTDAAPLSRRPSLLVAPRRRLTAPRSWRATARRRAPPARRA